MKLPHKLAKGDKVILSPSIKESDLTEDQIDYQKHKTVGTVSGRISQSVVIVKFPATEYVFDTQSSPFMDVELIRVTTKENN